MRVLGVAVMVLGVVGCGLSSQPRVTPSEREEAIASWRNVPLIILERHRLFSHRTPVVRTLSDGAYGGCPAR